MMVKLVKNSTVQVDMRFYIYSINQSVSLNNEISECKVNEWETRGAPQ